MFTMQNAVFVAHDRQRIDYVLRRSKRRRTLAVQVTMNSQVKVAVPYRTSQQAIDSFLAKHAQWIVKTLRRLNTQSTASQQQALTTVTYQGTPYPLQVVPYSRARMKIQFDSDGFVAFVPDRLPLQERDKLIRKSLQQWIRAQAAIELPARVEYFTQHHALPRPMRVVIRDQRTRWGSCSVRGTVSLNWRLMLAAPQVIDYVVVHELCHFKHPNHSQRFWRLVESILPDYRIHRQWLRKHGPVLQ